MNLTLGSVSGFLPTISKSAAYPRQKVVTHSSLQSKVSDTPKPGHSYSPFLRTLWLSWSWFRSPPFPIDCGLEGTLKPHLHRFSVTLTPCFQYSRCFRLRHRHRRMGAAPDHLPGQAIRESPSHPILRLYLHRDGWLLCDPYHHEVCDISVPQTSTVTDGDYLSWQASSSPNQSQRAVALGMLNTVGKFPGHPHSSHFGLRWDSLPFSGQCLSVLASYSFPTSQGPKFTKGITLNIAFQAFGFALALAMSAYFRWENKRRDRIEGPRAEGERLNVIEEFDLAPGKRWRTRCMSDKV